mmetsp:Transcript_82460/g.156913  ORF Transcript_82460/g.156913 Transcript_82460/m.156913 type:complete len:270 (-) Transcript_82460:24-833(-)
MSRISICSSGQRTESPASTPPTSFSPSCTSHSWTLAALACSGSSALAALSGSCWALAAFSRSGSWAPAALLRSHSSLPARLPRSGHSASRATSMGLVRSSQRWSARPSQLCLGSLPCELLLELCPFCLPLRSHLLSNRGYGLVGGSSAGEAGQIHVLLLVELVPMIGIYALKMKDVTTLQRLNLPACVHGHHADGTSANVCLILDLVTCVNTFSSFHEFIVKQWCPRSRCIQWRQIIGCKRRSCRFCRQFRLALLCQFGSNHCSCKVGA